MLKTLPLPKLAGDHVFWGNLPGTSLGYTLADYLAQTSSPTLIITPDSKQAYTLFEELRFFLQDAHPSLAVFPDWETLPYDMFSPHQDIISDRIRVLNALIYQRLQTVIVPINSLMYYIAHKDFIAASSFQLRKGEKLALEQLRSSLSHQGYYSVPRVLSHGEFAIRGSILDIFPTGTDTPYRIELFDEEIESIRTFDPETQLSLDKVEAINLLPAKEFPLDEQGIRQFRENWRSEFAGNPMACPIYQNISEGRVTSGIEAYLPLFYSQPSSLPDYFPAQATILHIGDTQQSAQAFWQEINERYLQCNIDRTKPLLAPQKTFLLPDKLFQQLNTFRQIHLSYSAFQKDKANYHNFIHFTDLPLLTINHQLAEPLIHLKTFIAAHADFKMVLVAQSPGRQQALLELLLKAHLPVHLIESWERLRNTTEKLNILIAHLEKGYIDNQQKIIIITESELFGEHVFTKRRKQQKQIDSDLAIHNLVELEIGTPVVHIDHGIGRFLGLQTITSGDITAEYLTLEYAGSDKLYVPVANLHLIGRYSGTTAEHAPLYKLGNTQWEKAKKKAQEQIRDVAAELLEIYAKRQAKQGFQFASPNEDYLRFAAGFPFEETPDQEKAIQDIIQDMTQAKPMDRLICGDVGFGKTEVAMRAAFLAVQSNTQVAILVPTTLLAEQHFENFKDRFAAWPVHIACLSRFRTNKQQQDIISDLENGKIDIIIGTHKLLQEKIKFHELGLLIIDEEHRFGVQQKEKIKALRAQIDILTLTATPIPRTLNMAMSGIRELSIIATPPERRLSVKTFVHERSKQLIREAVLREILRGGQVYFLHNKVDTIEKIAEEITRLVPEAKTHIAHGQLRERELERIMSDFYHQRFNVLVCTTIIETGIDIPTANTIIIDDADHFGVAQLHQLRGRVGRSHHQAYAYLMTPSRKSLSKDAIKRLEAIAAYDDLGVGFMLATHDLEIRGAGNLLGEEQSGNMNAIGFDLYMEALDKTVDALKSGQAPAADIFQSHQVEIDLKISALIPEQYLPDVHQRLVLYKRLASCKSTDSLAELKVEIVDRFGILPEEVKNLLHVHELRLKAQELGIRKLDAGNLGGKIEFAAHTKVKPETIIMLIQQKQGMFKLEGSHRLSYHLKGDTPAERLERAQQIFSLLEK